MGACWGLGNDPSQHRRGRRCLDPQFSTAKGGCGASWPFHKALWGFSSSFTSPADRLQQHPEMGYGKADKINQFAKSIRAWPRLLRATLCRALSGGGSRGVGASWRSLCRVEEGEDTDCQSEAKRQPSLCVPCPSTSGLPLGPQHRCLKPRPLRTRVPALG